MPRSARLRFREVVTQRLAARGFIEGRNLTIEDLTVEGVRLDPGFGKRLVAAKLDAIFALTPSVTGSVVAATRSVPIVFAWVPDPVQLNIVKDYARPGGNATGVSFPYSDIAVKRLELLRELLPAAKRVVVTGFLPIPATELAVTKLQKAASRLGFELIEQDITYVWGPRYMHEIKDRAQAVLMTNVFSWSGQVQYALSNLVQPALKERIPVIYAETEMVEVGGLISYGINLVDDVARGADMLAKILEGTRPADVPIDQASRFEVAVNLRTAKALGLTVPQSILLRAERVIE